MKRRLQLIGFIPFLLLAIFLYIVHYAWCIIAAPDRGFELAVSGDQLGNTATNGNPDETISSRAARARRRGRIWGCVLCGILDRIDNNHCENTLESRFLTDEEQPASDQTA